MITLDDEFREDYMPFLGNSKRAISDLAALEAMTDEQRAAKKARMDAIMANAANALFEKHGPLRTRPNPYWINKR